MNIQLTNNLGETLTVNYSSNNVHIYNSHLVAKTHIKDWVKEIKAFGIENGYVYSRSDRSWINEWKAHNLLFKWNIEPNRTKDVDLNEGETFLRKIGYFLLSILYI